MQQSQWFLLLGLDSDGQRRVYKAQLESREQAEALSRQLGFDEAATVLDEAAIARIGRYGYGFQLVYQIAPVLDATEYDLDPGESERAA